MEIKISVAEWGAFFRSQALRHREESRRIRKEARKKKKNEERKLAVETLDDSYIKSLLKEQLGSKEYITPELIDIKRVTLSIKRRIKKLKEPVKTCLVHGELILSQVNRAGIKRGKQQYKCKECQKALHAKNYEKNKEKILKRHANYKENNKEKVAKGKYDSWRKHKHKHVDKFRANNKRSYYADHAKTRERANRNKRIAALKLTDGYIKRLLRKETYRDINIKELTPEMIAAKRMQVMIIRSRKNIGPSDILHSIDTDLFDLSRG